MGAGVPVAGSVYLYYKYLDQVPLTQRNRWIATSAQWERQLGDQEYRQLLQQFQGQVLPKDHRASITVQRVGNRIYQASQAFCQEHQLEDQVVGGDNNSNTNNNNNNNNKPTFTVVRHDAANAFVLPNNHIFVMTGLFQFARDEDELAAVLGHEMAHNLARHVGEKVSGNFVVQVLARISLLVDPSGVLLTVFLPTATLLRELPHSRIHELEADHIGMHLAAMACYDPAAAQRVFRRMKEDAEASSSSQPPAFLSTHPSHESRIKKMADWLPETRRILERDGGASCRRLREDMALARRQADQRAAQREFLLLQSRE
jgi:predicted Zn-dependent protease